MSDKPKWTPRRCAEECDEASTVIADLYAALESAPEDALRGSETDDGWARRYRAWFSGPRAEALRKVKP